jgi:hypothetical protein
VIATVIQQVLSLVIDNELGGISVRLEREFFRDEAQPHVRLVPKET